MQKEKEIFMNEVKDKINLEKGFILARYQNMDVNLVADFRNTLLEQASEMFVIKKRVFINAAKDLGLEYDVSELQGHVALIMAKDNFVTTSKAFVNFSKENKGTLEVLGGHFEGKKCSSNEVEEISKLPTQSEIRAMFVGLLEAVPSQTVAVMDSAVSSIVYCLDNKIKKSA